MEAPVLEVDGEATVLVSPGGGSKKVNLKTNIEALQVKVSSDASSWIDCSLRDKALSIRVKENKMEVSRDGLVTIAGEGITKEVIIKQGGRAPYLLLSQNHLILDEYGGETSVEALSNRAVTVTIPEGADWIKQLETIPGGDKSKSILRFRVKPLVKGERSVALSFKTSEGTTPVQVSVIQRAGEEYKPDADAEMATDHLLKVASATASSYHHGEGIERAIDGDMTTIYHSDWNNRGDNYFPITLDFSFGKAEKIDYMVYYPRPDGSRNGDFKEVEIFAKGETGDFVSVAKDNFNGSKAPSKLVFKTPLTDVRTVRIVVKSGAGDGKGFAAAAEIQFFKNSTSKALEQEEMQKIFTDCSLSDIRPEVTEAMIQEMQNPTLMQIALRLKSGSYPREFRIADYKAWPHPDAQAGLNRNNPLNLLDNPTGIRVEKGEVVPIFVGPLQGRKVSLMLVDFDAPNGDGFGGRKVLPLMEGANRLKMPNKGLLYVLYHTKDYKTAPKIRIHFAGGKVQGYYDGSEPVDKYIKLLKEAPSDGYFDLVGKRAHLVFPVASYRQYTSGAKGKRLIDLYDEMVTLEERFQGHYKYNRVNVNRAFYHVMYHAFMYSAPYHTAYHVGTMSGILDPDVMRKSPWGQAHETGHCFQVRPNLLWRGMTEVTVNIQSMNIQTSWNPSDSRIQDENMRGEGGFINRYDKSYYWGKVQQNGFCEIRDVFCQLIPFWQIQLYYANAKGRKDVYMDIYERMRTAEIPRMSDGRNDNGQIQLNFYRDVSKIVGEDLWDFFEFWGFFKPVDKMIEDYSTELLRVTPEMVEKVRKEVQAMGLPKPAMPVQYICDANWTFYRDQKAITKGGPAKIQDAGRRLVIPKGWTGYVAIEVKDASGKLIGLANNNEVVIHNSHKVTKECKAYAIDYKGDRTPITIE